MSHSSIFVSSLLTKVISAPSSLQLLKAKVHRGFDSKALAELNLCRLTEETTRR